MNTICGHDREHLRIGLEMLDFFGTEALAMAANKPHPYAAAIRDGNDPTKLVKMLTEEAKRLGVDDGDRGNTSAVWFSFAWFKDGIEVSKYSWVFPTNEYRVRGICSDTWHWSFPSIKDITLPQARKLLSKWLQLPNMARKEAEQALRCES